MSRSPAAVVLFRQQGRTRLVSASIRTGSQYRSVLFTGRHLGKLVRRAAAWVGVTEGRVVVNNTHVGQLLGEYVTAPVGRLSSADYASKIVRAAFRQLHVGLLDMAVEAAGRGAPFTVRPKSTTHVFTDGSFDQQTGCGGWAAVGADGTLVACAGACTSSVQAELNALLLAYEHADIPADGQLVVHTDCQAVVTAVSRWRRAGYRASWLPDGDGFVSVFDDERLQVVWLKGHAGHHGNMVADQIAGLARRHAVVCAA